MTRAGRIRDRLALPASWESRLAELSRIGRPREPVELPRDDAARAVLARLRVPAEDAAEIVASLPEPERDPELWWLLERTCHRLEADLGGYGGMDGGPALPHHLGLSGAWFYVAVYLGALPSVRRFQRARGVPDDVAWASLADLGEKVAVHRQQYGVGGLGAQSWFTLHERGVLYALGRLQFNLHRLVAAAGRHPSGAPALNTHIPQWGGPFDEAACRASLIRARPFFDAHFPEHGAAVAVCDSWLLDPQLADYLPPESRIRRFQSLFTLVDAPSDEPVRDGDPPTTPGDRSVLEFVFRRAGQSLDRLPRRTTLQRAALDHLAAGRHWQQRVGWRELP